jgi:pyruvate dehydrogenase E1 component beta subunit
MSEYKDAIHKAMLQLAKNKHTIFIGYNTLYGSQIYGTLKGVPKEQLLETPVAENLMVGLAMGMSLEGYRPVVCFERTNFLYTAADAIRHHLCMLPKLSGGQFTFPVVIRAIGGYWRPLDPGPQHHTGDAVSLAKVLGIECRVCNSAKSVRDNYAKAMTTRNPILIVEHRMYY